MARFILPKLTLIIDHQIKKKVGLARCRKAGVPLPIFFDKKFILPHPSDTLRHRLQNSDQPQRFIQIMHQVEILNGHTGRAFQQIIKAGDDQNFAPDHAQRHIIKIRVC